MSKFSMNFRFDKEILVYIAMFGIIGLFVFNLSNVYEFNKRLFGKEDFVYTPLPDPVVPDPDPTPVVDDELTSIDLSGQVSYVCKKVVSESSVNGVKSYKVKIYGKNDDFTGIEQYVSYDGISDDFTNYVYLEKARYETLKSDNSEVIGFSSSVKLTSTSYLEALLAIDFTKASLDVINDKNDLIVKDFKDAKTVEVAKNYLESGGYSCE